MRIKGIEIDDSDDLVGVMVDGGEVNLERIVFVIPANQPVINGSLGISNDPPAEIEIFYRIMDGMGANMDDLYNAGPFSLKQRWAQLGGTDEGFQKQYGKMLGQ